MVSIKPVLGAVVLDGVKLKLFFHVFLRHLPKCVLVFFQQLEDCSELFPLNSETKMFEKHVEKSDVHGVRGDSDSRLAVGASSSGVKTWRVKLTLDYSLVLYPADVVYNLTHAHKCVSPIQTNYEKSQRGLFALSLSLLNFFV